MPKAVVEATRYFQPLDQYPPFHIAADVALMTIAPDQRGIPRLACVVVRHPQTTGWTDWLLPGRVLREGERITESVQTALRVWCGVEGLFPELLFVTDEPLGDPHRYLISLAYSASQPWSEVEPLLAEHEDAMALAFITKRGLALPDRQEQLLYGRNAVVIAAADAYRRDYRDEPDPRGLLGPAFTMSELREAHQIVLNESLDRDAFRRKMAPKLHVTSDQVQRGVGKPARLLVHKRGARP